MALRTEGFDLFETGRVLLFKFLGPASALEFRGFSGGFHTLLKLANRALSSFEAGGLPVDRFFFLFDSALDPFDLFAALGDLPVKFSTEPEGFVLGRDRGIAALILGLGQQSVRFILCSPKLRG